MSSVLPKGFGFETRRLRVATPSDWCGNTALVCETARILSPAVTAFLPPDLQVLPEGCDAGAWLAAATADAMVMSVRGQDGALFGLVLLHFGDGPQAMFGYLLAEAVWGRGYGTELIRGLADTLRQRTTIPTLVGGVDPANAASVRVLQKAGFAQRPGQEPGGGVFFALDLRVE
ncbi:MAG: GNAT family N-acetyltransferase [Rhodobacter sp.]|nr:GNAT family N-acetyltransferase [Rhodobacter sp.]